MSYRNSAGSANQAHFARIPANPIQRSVFNRNHTHKTTFDSGYVIPFLAQEILPGDSLRLKTHALIRLATPIFPYMDNVYADFHYFFIPNRLVWDNWEPFNGAQEDPDSSTDFLVPQLSAVTHAAGFAENSIYDYLGLPTKIASIPQANMPNSLILRAISLCFNDWYRDENLQDSLDFPTNDGPDTFAYALFRRGRRKDYFTSALPWPQKGPDVVLPLGGQAPVRGIGKNNKTWQTGSTTAYETGGVDATYTKFRDIDSGAGAGTTFYVNSNDPDNPDYPAIFADLSEATAATINELREAITVQQIWELDARGGTRYVEILLNHFGVVSPDFRLQRPEFLGGGTTNINVNPIAQSSSTDAESPQGNLAAFAVGRGDHGFNHSFVEHGHVIGFVSVRAETTYQQGLNRMWSRRTRFDFYWPTFANLGEQPIFNKEIMMQGTSADDEIFGYQERFAEYRYQPSMVTGKFRSNATGTLDSWHLGLHFEELPTLAGLVQEDPPIDRIIAVPSEPQFICDTYTEMRHARPMPAYSVPGLSRL